MNTNFRALISAEVALEEVPDALENIVAGLLHVEGEGVAAVPDLDEEDTLEEVLDGQEGRTQHLPPASPYTHVKTSHASSWYKCHSV